ncbi:MAG: hypothetical protein ACTHM9_16645 [Gemmatimonadales bacterium]
MDIMSEYRRLRPAFVLLHVTLALLLGIGGASTAVQASGAHAVHLMMLGGFEGVAAVLFLFPRTLRLGAAGLLLSCGVAFVAHAAMGQWRPDLVLYMVSVLFVTLHGAAYKSAPHGASAA